MAASRTGGHAASPAASTAPSSGASAACVGRGVGAGASVAPSAAAAEDFTGVTINVACNPTNVAHATAAGPLWEAKTGGKAVATLVPYAERALKFAADIVDQNPHFDLYFASKDFVAQFGDRLYAPIDKLGHRHLRLRADHAQAAGEQRQDLALPLFADQELFIYNKDYWTEAGLDPAAVPTTWDEMYALAPEADRPQGGKLEANATPIRPRRPPRTGSATTTASTCRSSVTTRRRSCSTTTRASRPGTRSTRASRRSSAARPGNNAASDLDWLPDLQPGHCRLRDRASSTVWARPSSGNAKDYKATIYQDGRGAGGDARRRGRAPRAASS